MPKTDLILLHAPSVYDFRKKPILHGPASDVVPSTQVFEMYPIGFMTILDYLYRHGYSARIINVALKMLNSRRFNPEKMIKSLSPVAFGIDLHWMVHAQGSLALAEVVKKHHPDIPVIFGGLSSSYFHEELIRYPQVDYVLRGDSTEEPLRQLLATIKGGGDLRDVPNLTWKRGGQVRTNELSYVVRDLEGISFDYRRIMKSCVKHFDLMGHLPFKNWFDYPIVAVLSCKGCVHNCTICGGSASAHRKTCGRTAPAHRKPETIARDMGVIARYIKAPIIILGDILQVGQDYARELLRAIKAEKIKNHVAFEFFIPPPTEFLEMIADAVPNFDIQISPESHDENIRAAFGRVYGNEALEKCITDALDLGCKRFDVFFMIGIPCQTPRSVRDTVGYCHRLLETCRQAGHGGKLHPYISPLAPFLDPGSRAFEEPEKYGYRLFHRTLEEHRTALLAKSWKYTLNYETKWMSRDELVELTYKTAFQLNRLKLEYGLLGRKAAVQIGRRIRNEKALMNRIDEVDAIVDAHERQAKVHELMRQFDAVGPSTICSKDEMNWPTGLIRFSPLRFLREAMASLRRRPVPEKLES